MAAMDTYNNKIQYKMWTTCCR